MILVSIQKGLGVFLRSKHQTFAIYLKSDIELVALIMTYKRHLLQAIYVLGYPTTSIWHTVTVKVFQLLLDSKPGPFDHKLPALTARTVFYPSFF